MSRLFVWCAASISAVVIGTAVLADSKEKEKPDATPFLREGVEEAGTASPFHRENAEEPKASSTSLKNKNDADVPLRFEPTLDVEGKPQYILRQRPEGALSENREQLALKYAELQQAIATHEAEGLSDEQLKEATQNAELRVALLETRKKLVEAREAMKLVVKLDTKPVETDDFSTFESNDPVGRITKSIEEVESRLRRLATRLSNLPQ